MRPLHAARMAMRGPIRAPGTALTAALTLGIALTATVTLFGTFFGSFRPLPVADGEDIVRIQLLDREARPAAPSPEIVEAWRREAGPLLGLGGTRSAAMTAVVEGGGAFRVSGAAVSPEVLSFLRIPPVRGRLLRPGPEDQRSVLVREDLWEEVGGPELGASLRLDGEIRTVVGIMPRDFGFPTMHELWTSLPDEELSSADQLVARLRPGLDRAVAAEILGAVLAAERAGDAGEGVAARARVLEYVDARGEGGEALAFGALGVLVVILLVLCTANASTLLLVRARERVDTLAIHDALGASRLQMVLQLLLESALVAGTGGLLGLVGGGLLLRWTQGALAVHWGYYWMRMEMQPSVVVATAAVVMSSAVVAGTLPAIQALRTDLRSVMGGERGRGGHTEGGRGGRWFVGAQVLLSTAGLVIALILLHGFERGRDLLPRVRAVSVSAGIPGWGMRSAPLRVEGTAPGDGGDPELRGRPPPIRRPAGPGNPVGGRRVRG